MSMITLAEDYKRYCDELAEDMSISGSRVPVNMNFIRFLLRLHSYLTSQFNDHPGEREARDDLMLREMALSIDLLMGKASGALSAAVYRERSVFLVPDFDEFGTLAEDIRRVSSRLSEALSSKKLPAIDKEVLKSITEIRSIIWNELERQKRPTSSID